MSSKRHRPHKGGTTPTTESKDRSGVVQFSVSEVAKFSMSLDNGRGPQTEQVTLMHNLNDLLAFVRMLAALRQGKALTALTPLLPTDFSFRLAVRCRWGQKP